MGATLAGLSIVPGGQGSIFRPKEGNTGRKISTLTSPGACETSEHRSSGVVEPLQTNLSPVGSRVHINMHYRFFVTFAAEDAQDPEAARGHVQAFLDEEGFCSQGRWGCGMA